MRQAIHKEEKHYLRVLLKKWFSLQPSYFLNTKVSKVPLCMIQPAGHKMCNRSVRPIPNFQMDSDFRTAAFHTTQIFIRQYWSRNYIKWIGRWIFSTAYRIPNTNVPQVPQAPVIAFKKHTLCLSQITFICKVLWVKNTVNLYNVCNISFIWCVFH